MGQIAKIDDSLRERRAILEILDRIRGCGATLQEMEQFGHRLRQGGNRALRPLLREIWRETSGEMITKYAFLLDFFDTSAWIDELIQIAIKRRDLGDEAKTALLIALEGYGVDVHSPPFRGIEFTGINNPLENASHGAVRAGEEGVVSSLDDFLSYPEEVQRGMISRFANSGDPHACRLLEAVLWHEDPELVRAALDALGRIRNPEAAGALSRYLVDAPSQFVDRTERNLRRLSFLGIPTPPSQPIGGYHAGYATPPDGDGYRSLMISRWTADGELCALYMQVHERRGLLAAWGAGNLDEEGFKAEVEGFSVQDDLHPVDPGYVIDLIRDALFWSKELCYLPADFYMRRGMFSGTDLSPIPYVPSFSRAENGRRLSFAEGEETCREIFSDPFFSGWFLAGERVQPYAEEYQGGADREKVLERFCRELLSPEVELIRERMLLTADLMKRCGRRPNLVGRMVSLAESLDNNPLPHHLHPFLRAFAIESLEIAREALAQQEELTLLPREERQ
ncbi:hypothetical protein GMSM_37850 [Geomonas sp. Red276]